MNENENLDLTTMTRGNAVDRSWKETPKGWMASRHDRRRMATTEMTMIAEQNEGMIHGPVMLETLTKYSTSDSDLQKLSQMFGEWMQKNAG